MGKSKAEILAEGTFHGIWGTVIGKGLRFALHIVLSYILPASQYGLFGLAWSIKSLSQTIGSLGLNGALLKKIPEEVKRCEWKLVYSVLLVGFLSSSVVAFIAYYITTSGIFFPDKKLDNIVYALCIAIPLYVTVRLVSSSFKGLKKIYKSQVIQKVYLPTVEFTVIVGGLIIGFNLGQTLLLIVPFLVIIVGAECSTLRKGRDQCGKQNTVSVKGVISYGLPLLFASATYVAVLQTDRLLVGHYLTSSDLAVYNISAIISINFSTLVAAPTKMVFQPMISDLNSSGFSDGVRHVYAETVKITAIIGSAIVIGVTALVIVLSGFLGVSYGRLEGLFSILIVGQFASVMLGPTGETLQMTKNQWISFATTIVLLLVNVVLCILLIGAYGVWGAAASTTISVVAVAMIEASLIYKIHGVNALGKNIIKYQLFAAMVLIGCVATIAVFGSSFIKILLLVSLSALQYIVVTNFLLTYSHKKIIYRVSNNFGEVG
jgi:O-antigen/teichoic acid export membrane protein